MDALPNSSGLALNEGLDRSFASASINGEILRFVEQTRLDLGLQPSQMYILDWGCGRGAYVEYLRNKGYQAFGVDISDAAIAEARKRVPGPDRHGEVIRKISVDNKTDFDAGMFHLVFSFQVLEHVSDLASLAIEMRRVSRTGARCLHIFPAKWRVLEVHLRMPFIHWVPKNELRRRLIQAFLLLGVRPRWGDPLPSAVRDRADVFFRYSCDNTYYRPLSSIRSTFSEQGFRAGFDVLNHPKLRAISWLPKRPLEWLILHFWSVQMVCEL